MMTEIKVFYFLMVPVHFGLLPWPALLTHTKMGFSLFQHKAFRYSIFCIFLLKLEVVGIFTWPLVRILMKTKKGKCRDYIFCSHPRSPSALWNGVRNMPFLPGVGPRGLHSALNT